MSLHQARRAEEALAQHAASGLDLVAHRTLSFFGGRGRMGGRGRGRGLMAAVSAAAAKQEGRPASPPVQRSGSPTSSALSTPAAFDSDPMRTWASPPPTPGVMSPVPTPAATM